MCIRDRVITDELYEEYLKELRLIGRDRLTLKHGLYTLFDYNPNLDPTTPLPMPICAAGKDKIIIKHNGDVYPCNFFQTNEYLCGNVLKDDILDIWKNGKGYIPFRSMILANHLPSNCKGCSYQLKCFGGCRLWTKEYREKGLISYEQDFRCQFK